MKALLALSLILASSPALANKQIPLCAVKQRNAASYTLAQEIGVLVQGAEVIAFENGPWTEMSGNNNGVDYVTVRIGNRINRGMTIKKYEVAAKQIGTTDDCNIKSVSEVQN